MNRLIIFILLIPVFFMISCQKDKPHKDLLKKDELVPLLIDLHLVYAIQSSAEFRKLSLTIDSVNTHSYIFDKYGVQKVVFDSSIAWYSRHPERFTKIYDEVVMNLTQMQDSLGGDEEP